MGAFGQAVIAGISALLLTACVSTSETSETRSLVSTADVPSSKYKNIAVFVENLLGEERSVAEQQLVLALRDVGVNAKSGPEFLRQKRIVDEQAKGPALQNNFDGLLFVSVVEKGTFGQVVPNVSHDGTSVTYRSGVEFLGIRNFFGSITLPAEIDQTLTLNDDGTATKENLALKLKIEIQDTKSAKIVWRAETIASGLKATTDLAHLYGVASKQIVTKIREDHAI